jgi:hypothetical protein
MGLTRRLFDDLIGASRDLFATHTATYVRAANSDYVGYATQRCLVNGKSHWPFKRRGKLVRAICIAPAHRQGQNRIYFCTERSKFYPRSQRHFILELNQRLIATRIPGRSAEGLSAHPPSRSPNQRRLPCLALPSQPLGQSIDLIIMTTGKRE